MIHKFGFLHAISDGLFNIRVTCFVKREAWEQIINQTHEEWLIFVHQLAQVHVTKNSHHDTIFTVLQKEAREFS